MKSYKFSKSLISAAVATTLGLPALALAQDAEQEEETATEESVERIVVTGSRIRTDSFANATPIDIISVEDAEEQGITTLGELLRTSTVAAGADQITQALATGYVVNGGAGAETISMRGLGANRTLVLLNGRRAGPAGTRGAVSSFDMNAIPITAIKRVEILKDGASSLYGSDAVAGVINIITKTDDSKTFSADISQPEQSGGETQRFNMSWGETFDSGSMLFVADYNARSALLRGDRDFYACSERYLFDENGERGDPIDPRTGDYHCNDTGFGMWVYGAQPGAKLFYDYDGWLGDNGYDNINEEGVISNPNDDNWYMGAYSRETDPLWNLSHPFRDKETMLPENETVSLYFQADYELTDTINAYSEILYSSRTTETQGYRQFWTGQIGPQPAASLGFDAPGVLLMPVALTDHYGSEVNVDYTRFVAGLTGSIGFWDWDISYQNSHNDGTYKNDVIFYDSMIMAQLNLMNGTSCQPGQVTDVSGRPCVNVDFSDPQLINGNPSQEVRDFLFGTEMGQTIYKQQTLEGYVTGDLFTLPAGPVSTAVGMSFQRDEIDDTPGETSAAGNSWGLSSASRTAGSQNTKAVFGEVNIPVLVAQPFADSLDITASYRWTDVDTYGDDSTYKIGLNWAITENWRVRASRGTSFRSPALFELYLAGQTAFPGQMSVDPCYDYGNRYDQGSVTETVYQNCLADGIPLDYDGSGTSSVTEITSGGGTGLGAETSVAESVGIVWTSPENTYALSVDYYDILISGQVSKLNAGNIVGTCYRSQDFPNDPLCDLFTRNDGTNGDWGIDEVQAGYVNVASQGSRGIDFNFTYNQDFDFGSVRVVLKHTKQLDHTYKLFEDSVERNYIGEIGEPEHIGTLSTSLSRDNWTATWTMRYADRVTNIDYYFDGDNTTTYRGEEYTFVGHVPTTVYHTLSGNVRFFDGLDLTVGVSNIFDKEPPKVSLGAATITGNAVLASQYDQIGRRVFANLTYSF